MKIEYKVATMVKLVFRCMLLVSISLNDSVWAYSSVNNFLLQPSGEYSIAYEDLHWINNNICPDPQMSNVNESEFSQANIQHCHELMIRLYYPTAKSNDVGSLYYHPTVEVEQATLSAIDGVKKEHIEQLSQLKSHTTKNAPPVLNEKFPVILFSPGFGVQTQLYENIITELVSHGFIVVGINAVLINGDIELPNSRVINTIPHIADEVAEKIMPMLEQDIAFVYSNIHAKTQHPVFKAMDVDNIGAMGHSIGARALANIVNLHNNWFKALLTYDMASFDAEDSSLQIKIPHMHIISAYWKSSHDWPIEHHLGTNGYLVVLSPSTQDKHYSYHMNFSDFSTLQYLPAYQAARKAYSTKQSLGEEVIFLSNMPRENQFRHITKPCYVIVNLQNSWKLFYQEAGNKLQALDIKWIPHLQKALNNLPPISKLTPSDRDTIKLIIHAYHQGYGQNLGTGNGFEITKAINVYTLTFFKHFLKKITEDALTSCSNLSDNTQIDCGHNQYKSK